MERLCPCGCGRPIRFAMKRVALTYVDATAVRELVAHLASLCRSNDAAGDERLRSTRDKIDTLVDTLKRSLHYASRRRDATYIERMRRPLGALGHGLAMQIEAIDPAFFRDWSDRTRARQRAA